MHEFFNDLEKALIKSWKRWYNWSKRRWAERNREIQTGQLEEQSQVQTTAKERDHSIHDARGHSHVLVSIQDTSRELCHRWRSLWPRGPLKRLSSIHRQKTSRLAEVPVSNGPLRPLTWPNRVPNRRATLQSHPILLHREWLGRTIFLVIERSDSFLLWQARNVHLAKWVTLFIRKFTD